jgi:hypothetical protein
MASRFWVGGTGEWNSSNTANWSATDGGAGGASVPTSIDTATLSSRSGAGTVTVNGAVTVTTLTCGSMDSLVLDFATNNNNVTVGTFAGSGTGTRDIRLGSGTWNITNTTGTIWSMATTTNLTWSGSLSTIILASGTATGARTFAGGGLNYNSLIIGNGGGYSCAVTGANNFSSAVTVYAPNYVSWINSATNAMAGLSVVNAVSSSPIGFVSATTGGAATLSITSSGDESWTSWRDITVSTSNISATNSFDLGRNTGVTITPPVTTTGGGGGGVIIGG